MGGEGDDAPMSLWMQRQARQVSIRSCQPGFLLNARRAVQAREPILRLLHQANQRCTHRLGQSIEDHHALASAAGGQGFGIPIEN